MKKYQISLDLMVIYNPKSMRLTEFREKCEFDFPHRVLLWALVFVTSD